MANWRKTREYRVWRAQVIRRDKCCVICGNIKGRAECRERIIREVNRSNNHLALKSAHAIPSFLSICSR
jgi:hypothetical protein